MRHDVGSGFGDLIRVSLLTSCFQHFGRTVCRQTVLNAAFALVLLLYLKAANSNWKKDTFPADAGVDANPAACLRHGFENVLLDLARALVVEVYLQLVIALDLPGAVAWGVAYLHGTVRVQDDVQRGIKSAVNISTQRLKLESGGRMEEVLQALALRPALFRHCLNGHLRDSVARHASPCL